MNGLAPIKIEFSSDLIISSVILFGCIVDDVFFVFVYSSDIARDFVSHFFAWQDVPECFFVFSECFVEGFFRIFY